MKKAVNGDVKAEMARYGITQKKLAKLIGLPQGSVSLVLKRELSEDEQRKLIEAIKEGAES